MSTCSREQVDGGCATMEVLTFAFWISAALLAISLGEYVVHRWVMHGRWLAHRTDWGMSEFERHAVLHHGRFYRSFEGDSDMAARHLSIAITWQESLTWFSPIWLTSWLLAGLTVGLTVAAIAALYGPLWTIIHREMHEPAGKWWARLFLYRIWRENHRLHHERVGSNFGTVFPGVWDRVFGTYRRA